MVDIEKLLRSVKVLHSTVPSSPSNITTIVSIPAIREEKTIAKVIREVRMQLGDSAYIVICVKDSNDPTIGEAIRAGTDAVLLQPHVGYGLAHITAMRYGLTLIPQAKVIVMVDGDGTYDLSRLKEMVKLALENKVVIGNRLYRWPRKSMGLINYIGNILLSRLVFRLLFNARGPDTQTGLKVFPSNMVYMFRTIGMEFSTEVLVIAVKMGLPIVSIPIEYYPRKGSPSKLRPFRDFIRILLYMVKNSILKFSIVGLLSLAFSELVLASLLAFNVPKPLAFLIAGESSIWFGFTLNDSIYAHRHERKSLRGFFIRGLKYNLIYLVSTIIASSIAVLLYIYVGVHPLYSNLVASLCLLPMNYFLNIAYTWRWTCW